MSTRLKFTKSRNNGNKYGRKKTRKKLRTFGRKIQNVFRRKKPQNMGYLQIAKKEKQKQLMKFLTGNSDELFYSDDSQKTSPASSQASKGLLFDLPEEKIPVDFNFVKQGEGKAIGERSMSPVYIPPPYGHINAKRRNTQTQNSEELMEVAGLMSKKKKTKKKKTKKKKKKPTTSRREGKRRRCRSRSRRR